MQGAKVSERLKRSARRPQCMCYLRRYQAEGQPERPERTVTARLTVATLPKSREAKETKMTLR